MFWTNETGSMRSGRRRQRDCEIGNALFSTQHSEPKSFDWWLVVRGSWFGETQICVAMRLRLSRVTYHVSRSFRPSNLSDAASFVAGTMMVLERTKSGSGAQRTAKS